MIVEDARKNRPIFIAAALDDSDLDPYEFRVYARLARRAGFTGEAYESIDNMATALKMGEHKLRACLKSLEARGMVERIERRGQTTKYVLLDEEFWHPLQISNGSTPYGSVTPPVTDESRVPLTDQSHEGSPSEGNPEKEKTPSNPPRGEEADASLPPVEDVPVAGQGKRKKGSLPKDYRGLNCPPEKLIGRRPRDGEPPFEAVEMLFVEFARQYPRHESGQPGKADARHKFFEFVYNAKVDARQIVRGAVAYRKAMERRGWVGTDKIKHMSTFMNQAEWENYGDAAPVPETLDEKVDDLVAAGRNKLREKLGR